ncbi:DUF1842 domain-containing protein [Sphingomonas sp.]|uniref:DUF1842 domain-containing protein n=1 Tax=Sphingomonas sp. TaxID=28214 RepID=UPI002E36FB71|nr:DUF1842 domain-containing protein [Sphingomonas sp.]HEX4695561.1 DUF1842 domain-containing protein [Sphingomonas sp.]
MADTKVGLYLVNLIVQQGTTPLAGAPVLHLALAVNAPTGSVNGTARITQALAPPYGDFSFPVSGNVHHTGFGTDTLLVALKGDYVVSVPPPAIGSFLAHFFAALAVDKGWNGTGSFIYGNHTVAHCTVVSQ